MTAKARGSHPRPKDRTLLSSDFTQTGLFVHRTGPPPARFQVLGERSSGTNLVSRLLAQNSTLQQTDVLGWKHGPPGMMAIPPDLAVICVVRNAADWALSMHAKPWHTTPVLQALEFSEFIRAPWHTILDRPRYFDTTAGLIGQPLQADRDPVNGAVFPNLFALRRSKLTGLLGYLNRGCTVAVLRLESVQAHPRTTLDELMLALDQPARAAPFRMIKKRLGSRFKPAIAQRPATPARLSSDNLAFMASQLDPEQEAGLGYSYEG